MEERGGAWSAVTNIPGPLTLSTGSLVGVDTRITFHGQGPAGVDPAGGAENAATARPNALEPEADSKAGSRALRGDTHAAHLGRRLTMLGRSACHWSEGGGAFGCKWGPLIAVVST
jgi:hypothetical protein